MSKEELIDEIEWEEKWLASAGYNAYNVSIAFDSIKHKVNTLEQEPCEDAISRQAVLDMATTIQTNDYSGNETMKVIDVDDIKTLPSVTPTRKKGKWTMNSEFPDEISCSCCNNNYDMWFWEQGTMNYCPHCGAEMDESEE